MSAALAGIGGALLVLALLLVAAWRIVGRILDREIHRRLDSFVERVEFLEAEASSARATKKQQHRRHVQILDLVREAIEPPARPPTSNPSDSPPTWGGQA